MPCPIDWYTKTHRREERRTTAASRKMLRRYIGAVSTRIIRCMKFSTKLIRCMKFVVVVRFLTGYDISEHFKPLALWQYSPVRTSRTYCRILFDNVPMQKIT